MANFLTFLPLVLDVEGGYQNSPHDSGNYNSLHQLVGTNRGISAPVYEDWIGHPPSAAEMRAITAATAQAIYKAWYWDAMRGDQIIDQNVATLIVDCAVNSGVSRAGKILQGTLNKYFHAGLTVDGNVGPKTIAATNAVPGDQLFANLKIERIAWYNYLGGEDLEGWLERLTHFIYTGEKKKKSPSRLA